MLIGRVQQMFERGTNRTQAAAGTLTKLIQENKMDQVDEEMGKLEKHQSPVPNCPGLRPGLFGTGCWSVCNEFPANADPRPASEARARDRNQQ